MSVQVFNSFIEKVTIDEAFREDLVANPKKVLASLDLSKEELDSIRHGAAWQWLRDQWHAPPDWK